MILKSLGIGNGLFGLIPNMEERNGMEIKFCSCCGAPMEKKIPPDDDHPRYVCTRCTHVYYENPKMVVGCIPIF